MHNKSVNQKDNISELTVNSFDVANTGGNT